MENASRFYLCIYIRPSCYRPGSELTDHTEYAFAIAFVSVGVVCQRNEQTRFVDITRRLDNSAVRSNSRRLYSFKCGMSICVRAKFIDRYINQFAAVFHSLSEMTNADAIVRARALVIKLVTSPRDQNIISTSSFR